MVVLNSALHKQSSEYRGGRVRKRKASSEANQAIGRRCKRPSQAMADLQFTGSIDTGPADLSRRRMEMEYE